MQAQGPNIKTKKELIAKNLSRILQNSCVQCYCEFNSEDRSPLILYPCQHIYCEYCVKNQLLKTSDSGICTICSKAFIKANIQKSKLAIKILKIIQQFSILQQEANWQTWEKKVACKLFSQGGGYLYECTNCNQPYDRLHRLPIIVCQNQHIMCSQCLCLAHKTEKCKRCRKKHLSQFFTNKIIINVSEFVYKTLFCQNVAFVINQRELNVVTHSQTTIKDIFHHLQEFDHLSNKLQIKLCKFYKEVVKQYDFEKQVIAYDQKIGSGKIKKIFLQFGEQALNVGSKITMPSKIIDELPIKITNFQLKRRPQLAQLEQEQDNVFGQKVQIQKSLLYQKMLQSSLKVKRYEKQQAHSIFRKQQTQSSIIDRNKLDFQKNKQYILSLSTNVSQSKMKLLNQSIDFEQQEAEDYDKIYDQLMKGSRVKRNGKQLPEGTQIKPLFIQNINTKLPQNKRTDVLQCFLKQHQVNQDDKKYLCYDVYRTMNQPFSQLQLQESKQMEKVIQQKALQGDRLSLTLHLLKKELQDGQIKIIFTPKSTKRSKLTLKTLTSHFLSDRFVIQEQMLEEQEFAFQNMNADEALFQQFIKKQISKYVNRFGLSQQNIVLHNVVKGSNIIILSTNQGQNILDNIKNNLDKGITIHPYFTQLQLSPQDFDQKGNITFFNQKKDIQFRGNWPYYQPIKCTRYGIKVSKQFDNGDDTWLQMKNGPGQWVVGFHGVRNPNTAYKECKNVIYSILNGLHQPEKQMLIVVQRANQAYYNNKCINKGEEKVGRGVYLSPMFYETLSYTSPQKVGDKQYHLVFQCRLQPQSIRIPDEKQYYWVVGSSVSIRPYGIVLIENKDRKSYPKPTVQFGEDFSYEKYRQRLEDKSQQEKTNNSTVF